MYYKYMGSVVRMRAATLFSDLMAKIYPSTGASCPCSSSERETFTVWMKSLVFNGNGCTVFDSKGDVVYRVENYQKAFSSEVFLMDSSGKALFSMNRKKLSIFGFRGGFKRNGNSKVDEERPWFQVKTSRAILSKDLSCRVTLKCNVNTGDRYKIVGSEGKSAITIIDFSGKVLAEAVQKQSSEGVCFGADVLTLMVEPNADQSLIMALVTVYGLINNKL